MTAEAGPGATAALELDERRFARLWARLGLRGDSHPVFAALSRAWGEPHRAYHTADHLRDCLAQLDRHADAARRPDEVELALWFHDAVYDPRSPDNEARSAAWADRVLTDAGGPDPVRRRVADLVLATRHDSPPADPDARLLVDLDLSILGRGPAEFARFERRIRREYAWVPEPAYRQGRAEVLERFLRRDPLYLTPGCRRRWEAAARRNLADAVAALRGGV